MSGSDFGKRFGLGAPLGALQQDIESSMARAKTSTVAEAEAYTPDDPTQWASPPPTTKSEALDRLAKAGATNTWPA